MPKVTITFNLPEENSEYKCTSKASDMSLAIWDFTQLVREKDKHGDGSSVTWYEVKEAWWGVLKEYGLDPYEE
jgi:hypothetical protein